MKQPRDVAEKRSMKRYLTPSTILATTALFFALGWMAARIDIKHLLRESRALPLTYFRGLNFLLNEQPDKAIELYLAILRQDPAQQAALAALDHLYQGLGRWKDLAATIEREIEVATDLADVAKVAELKFRRGAILASMPP